MAVVVALLVASASARPQAADESEVGGATGDHLFHGSHLWGLEDFHEDAEDRKRRAAEEEGAAGDHGDHLFHGTHLWGLGDYHEGSENRKRRAAEEEGTGASRKEKRTTDDDTDDGTWVPLQNSDGNPFFHYNIFD